MTKRRRCNWLVWAQTVGLILGGVAAIIHNLDELLNAASHFINLAT